MSPPPSPAPGTYARYVLGFLTPVYITNFIDRIVLGILVGRIKAELHLSDWILPGSGEADSARLRILYALNAVISRS